MAADNKVAALEKQLQEALDSHAMLLNETQATVLPYVLSYELSLHFALPYVLSNVTYVLM